MVDYKDTLNLPYTKFAMKANLSKYEPVILERWYNDNLYYKIRNYKKGKKKFFLYDGPPYANGPIHIGHSINKIIKDFILKFKGLMGYDAPYLPGWDCHGLPIELNVEKLCHNYKIINNYDFFTLCRDYVNKQIINQKKDFIRLGVLGNWENPYLTMSFSMEANIVRIFSKIVSYDYLYSDMKPVHWCVKCRSTLSEAEVEYFDIKSPSLYVLFHVIDYYKLFNKLCINRCSLRSVSMVVWTTTPWTIPANRAIAVNERFSYKLLEIDGHGYILSVNSVCRLMKRLGAINYIDHGIISGYDLAGIKVISPFSGIDVFVVLSNHVVLDRGTGIVHIAPGHGPEDYEIGKKCGLEVLNLINKKGEYIFDYSLGLKGLNVYQVNLIIVNLLISKKMVFLEEEIKHSCFHCCRHKIPVVFRTTFQWFIDIDHNDLRSRCLNKVDDIKWIPGWGRKRIIDMISKRPAWCISRQRRWGVPMSLFIHKEKRQLHPKINYLMKEVAKRINKKGVIAWWDLKLIDVLHKNEVEFYEKSSDVLDVWFDSGATYHFVFNNGLQQFNNYYSDICIEGYDQYRGWFMSLLIISTAINDNLPCRSILTHGFVVDNNGVKMSKSTGNVINPRRLISKFGVDIFRLWVASIDYTKDMSISDISLKSSIDIYRCIRNTSRFLLANLYDFNFCLHKVISGNMIELDKWAVGYAYIIQNKIINYYNNYDFHNVVKSIVNFCSIKMSALYLDIVKDRLYTMKKNSIARRSCQTALFHILESLVRWISPIISFTADEIWNYMPNRKLQYVFMDEWYNGLFFLDDQKLINNSYWERIFLIRSEINKLIEISRINRIINTSLEAEIILYVDDYLLEDLSILQSELHFIFLVSKVTLKKNIDCCDSFVFSSKLLTGLRISLFRSKMNKCIRCWHFVCVTKDDLGNDNNFNICSRCKLNVFGSGEVRKFI